MTLSSRSAIALFIAVVLAVSDAASVRAGLIAYYAAEGNANDSADGHNGTALSGVTYDAGKFGQAFQLNGAYISVPDDPALTLGDFPFTISVWANVNSISAGGLGTLPNVFIGHDEQPGTHPKWVFFYDGNGKLAFHINGGDGGSVFLTPATTIAPLTAEWHNYAITRNAQIYSFYYDGTFLGLVADHSTIPDANAPMTIGQVEGLGQINGRLDDIRIYDTALSPSEIAALQSVPGDYNQNGTVDAADYAVWRKNQGTTNSLPNDAIGGTIGSAQYNQWRAHFGLSASGVGTGAITAVPETTTAILFSIGAVCMVAFWRLRTIDLSPAVTEL
jgi:hypothetical protein